jgi:hypothetical protein
MDTKQKFRASFSVLSLWQSGRWEDAINAYFKLEEFATQQMIDGKALHAEWEKETGETLCLPAIFGGQKLVNAQSELKLVVELEPWLDLVGVIDCYDNPDIHEFKSGVKSSQSYARDKQIGVYAVLCILSDMPAKRLFIHHWNQYTKQADTSIVWVTEQLLKDTVAWVETTAAEMHSYFTENNLYERFGKK